MARRYLGYGTTNSQGIATLDHDPEGNTITGYTGVGAGLVDIIATSGTLQSETFVLEDYIKYDYGTQGNHSDIWSTPTQSATLTREDEYTEIAEANANTTVYVEVPFETAIEFDFCVVDGRVQDYFYNIGQSGNNYYAGCGIGQFERNLQIGEWYHCKIQINNANSHTIQINEYPALTRTASGTYTTSNPFQFRWWTSEQITKLRFKEFKAYPI